MNDQDKATLENAADLLEELGHAGCKPLRELIRAEQPKTSVRPIDGRWGLFIKEQVVPPVNAWRFIGYCDGPTVQRPPFEEIVLSL